MKQVSNHLAVTESKLWSGSPNERIWLSKDDIAPILTSAVFLIFGLYALSAIPNHPPTMVDIDWYISFWYIPGICVVGSLYVICKTVVLNYLNKRNLLYVITNERVMAINKSKNKIIKQVPIHLLNHMEVSDNGEIGHITFYKKSLLPVKNGITVKYSPRGPLTFWEIEDVNEVYNVIQRLRQHNLAMLRTQQAILDNL